VREKVGMLMLALRALVWTGVEEVRGFLLFTSYISVPEVALLMPEQVRGQKHDPSPEEGNSAVGPGLKEPEGPPAGEEGRPSGTLEVWVLGFQIPRKCR
jgi:hypothetical protein